MSEEWKLLYEFTDNRGRYYIKGDKLFVSNKGNVKLNDRLLDIGNGLKLSKKQDAVFLTIEGFANYPAKNLYRSIYYLFTGKKSNSCSVNIHHIDYDITNNSIDNLIMLSSFEHGKIHNADNIIHSEGYYKLQRKQDIINKYINITNDNYINELTERKNKIIQEQKDIKLIEREQRKQKLLEQKELLKQQEIERKLLTGLYKYNKNGKLYKFKRPEQSSMMKSKWNNDEYKQHISNTIKQKYLDNPEYRETISIHSKQMWKDEDYKKRMSDIVKERWQDEDYKKRLKKSLSNSKKK